MIGTNNVGLGSQRPGRLRRALNLVRTLYIRVTGRRHWQAASPAGTFSIGFLTDAQALVTGQKLGRVSFVDHDRCVVFFDTHLGSRGSQS